MIYKFDDKNLTYKDITKNLVLGIIGVIVLFISISLIFALNKLNDIRYISSETKSIIIRESAKENEFNPKKLRAYILELNIKYPHIVYAQAEIETGHFTSQIFKENSNCFGLKQATKRPTTNKNNDTNYGYYNNWKSSVVDYAFLQSTFIYKINSEDEYFDYLKQFYAEDTNYVNKLKRIINENSF